MLKISAIFISYLAMNKAGRRKSVKRWISVKSQRFVYLLYANSINEYICVNIQKLKGICSH